MCREHGTSRALPMQSDPYPTVLSTAAVKNPRASRTREACTSVLRAAGVRARLGVLSARDSFCLFQGHPWPLGFPSIVVRVELVDCASQCHSACARDAPSRSRQYNDATTRDLCFHWLYLISVLNCVEFAQGPCAGHA
jgi:hypothetical protein